jgi:glycosyltransferase involved in cell wall biosynthesis
LFHANILARMSRLMVPVPVVISTLHSVSESGRRRADTRWRDRVYRASDLLTDQVVAVCEAVAGRHIACGAARASKYRVIANGVDGAAFRPDGERRAAMRRELDLGEKFVWLAAGRLMWKKDYATMLRAFASRSGSVLLVAGTGPQSAELRELALQLGADVRWLGAREDMAALMNAADALVLSSVVEGLPVVLLEAAASGLIAVSTDAGGAREAIAEGETGFIVPVGNAEALAATMAMVESLDAARRERMSRAARERAMRLFDQKAVALEWERCYDDLLGGARRGQA